MQGRAGILHGPGALDLWGHRAQRFVGHAEPFIGHRRHRKRKFLCAPPSTRGSESSWSTCTFIYDGSPPAFRGTRGEVGAYAVSGRSCTAPAALRGALAGTSPRHACSSFFFLWNFVACAHFATTTVQLLRASKSRKKSVLFHPRREPSKALESCDELSEQRKPVIRKHARERTPPGREGEDCVLVGTHKPTNGLIRTRRP